MRCLISVPSLMRAGAETQAIDLANGLSLLGHDVHLCTFEPQLDQQDRLLEAVRFHHLPRKRKYDLSLIARIARLIDREKIEIVQGVMQFATLIAWLATRRSIGQPPVVAAIHTTLHRGLKDELQDRLIYRRMLRSLPAIVFVCRYQREYWITKYPELEPTARVIHNGVDVSRFRRTDFSVQARSLRSTLGIPETAFVFSCIAGFRPEKGHRLLVHAFASLPGDTHLLLAGDGPERPAVEAVVRARDLQHRVRFLGNVMDVRPVIVASNATVLPSTAVETFSLAMLESMALEVPLIASKMGGVAEAITDRETGLLCSPGDIGSLASQMRYLVELPSEAKIMGQAAEAKVGRCFNLERMVERYESVLVETCLQRRGRRQ
jgi:glycosyltransferase involved in cell wall biosynthesis